MTYRVCFWKWFLDLVFANRLLLTHRIGCMFCLGRFFSRTTNHYLSRNRESPRDSRPVSRDAHATTLVLHNLHLHAWPYQKPPCLDPSKHAVNLSHYKHFFCCVILVDVWSTMCVHRFPGFESHSAKIVLMFELVLGFCCLRGRYVKLLAASFHVLRESFRHRNFHIGMSLCRIC